jgi:Arc/MetJ-type ribon-helix-helix transcriptional regulator
MTLTLDPKIQAFVDQQVKEGRFRSPVEVLEAGVARLMLDSEPDIISDDEFPKILNALKEIEVGDVVDGNAFHAEMRRRYLKAAT